MRSKQKKKKVKFIIVRYPQSKLQFFSIGEVTVSPKKDLNLDKLINPEKSNYSLAF